MADFTPNYRLHQWEPTDPFLREDFNQDLSTIDTALGEAAQQSQKALAHLEQVDYHLYNLMLQNQYEGHYTGYKKALIFDGFMDESGISEKSDSLFVTKGTLLLSGSGQGNLSLGGYGSQTGYNLDSTEVTASGVGLLTGFQCKLINPYSEPFTPTLNVILTINGEEVFSQKVSGPSMTANATSVLSFSFGSSFILTSGDRIKLRLENATNQIYYTSDGEHLAGSLLCTGRSGSNGQMTARPQELPAFQKALAWVRHKGGAVSVKLVRDGQTYSFGENGQREVTDLLSGSSCTERAFLLNESGAAGQWAVRLELDRGGDGLETVYDYGVVVI